MLSTDTGLPVPPMDAVPNAGLVEAVTHFYVVVICAAVIFALLRIRREEGRIILIAMVAGAVTSLSKPILDLIGAAWYPHIGIPVAFELMGRPIPVWVVLASTVYFGRVGSFTILPFKRGLSYRQVWLVFVIPSLIDSFGASVSTGFFRTHILLAVARPVL